MIPREAEPLAARLRATSSARGLDLARLEVVLAAASKAHTGQTRADGAPYIVHPIRVATVVVEDLGLTEPDLVSAALLHDTVEDTPFTLDDVEELAGSTVRELVDLLTKPEVAKGSSKAERDKLYFQRLRKGPSGASAVKCADRIDNLRDMTPWKLEKKKAYVAEAREKILPVAQERAPGPAAVLLALIEKLERELG